MNSRKLKAVMVLNGDTVVELASILGITTQSVRNKMSERSSSEFKQGEIAIIRSRYNLTAEQVDEIFFS